MERKSLQVSWWWALTVALLLAWFMARPAAPRLSPADLLLALVLIVQIVITCALHRNP